MFGSTHPARPCPGVPRAGRRAITYCWPLCPIHYAGPCAFAICPVCLCYLARVPYTLLSSLYALYIMHGFISAVEIFVKVAFTPFYEPRAGDFHSKISLLRFSLMLIWPQHSRLCFLAAA